MASAGTADGFFRCIYEGCLSGCDTGIERRPYHRYCGCALHSKSKNNHRVHGLPPRCKGTVSYPMRRSYSEGSLLVLAAASSPKIQLGSCHPELDDDHHNTISFF
ncbi:hypothetical protein WN943_003027 [Citrus x changshan-huyou]|uniref:Uncharacterized protein n=1 Tax=Citrus unshiu TaxID=55188 RepID=A0A2H5PWG3_CITUN|nr:hypothetical protein CUMW_173960 [Citrus unshiu]